MWDTPSLSRPAYEDIVSGSGYTSSDRERDEATYANTLQVRTQLMVVAPNGESVVFTRPAPTAEGNVLVHIVTSDFGFPESAVEVTFTMMGEAPITNSTSSLEARRVRTVRTKADGIRDAPIPSSSVLVDANGLTPVPYRIVSESLGIDVIREISQSTELTTLINAV